MLPELNQDGNLPEGIHLATEEEVLVRFATSSARRRWLGEQLQNLLGVAKSTERLHRAFLWGSFVTSKESPNDLDILLVMTGDFTVDALPEKSRVLFDYTDARLRFHADVFWTKASIDAGILALWLDTYQVGKDFKRRGIVEIRLS